MPDDGEGMIRTAHAMARCDAIARTLGGIQVLPLSFPAAHAEKSIIPLIEGVAARGASLPPRFRLPDPTMIRYQWFKRWAQLRAKKWAQTRTKWRAQVWGFLLGPYTEAPPSDSRRMARFSARSVFVSLGIAGACHLAAGLVLYTILGVWTATESGRPHVRTVRIHLLPPTTGTMLESPPLLGARTPEVPAPPVHLPPPEPIAPAKKPSAPEGRITPQKEPLAAPVDTAIVSSSDGGNGGAAAGVPIGIGSGVPAGTGQDAFVAFDTPPQRLSEIEPDYPDLAIDARSQGTVLVLVTIDETGRVTDAVVIKSDVISVLDQAAIKAAKATPFRPAKQRDVPVTSRVVLPFRFKLKTEEGE